MRPFGCALAFTWLLSLPAFADLTILSKVTNDNKVGTNTDYFTSERARMSNADVADAIMDFASGNITLIDNKKKQYSVMTKKQMEAMAAQLDAQMKQMEAQMANLPPAIREKMSGMTMGGMAGEINVQKGTGGRKIAGYSCQNWIITAGQMLKQESCVTTELELPVAVFDAQKSLYGGMGTSGPMGKFMKSIAEKFKEMKGFPLATTTTVKMMGKSMVSTMEVTEVKKGPVPASAFEIPAGYKKVESPAAKMMK